MSYATISYVLNEMICLDGREKARRTYNQVKLIEQFRNSYCWNTELVHRTHILVTVLHEALGFVFVGYCTLYVACGQ